MTFDPDGILALLRKHRVRFVLIGGLAAAARGSPVVTFDFDICYERTPSNMEKLVVALRAVNAKLRGAPTEVPFLLDFKTIAAGDAFTFITDLGPFDCLGTPAGTNGFDELERNAETFELSGGPALVASLRDLIAMKEAAGRDKDKLGLEHLAVLLEEEESKGFESP